MKSVLVLPILVALVSGWIINYLADVLPVTRRFSRPACVNCHHEFSLFNYLVFGKCQNCGQPRGWRAWIVMAATIGISVYIWLNPHRMGYALGMLLVSYFAVVFVIDLEHRLILHLTSIVGALLGLGIGLWTNGPLSTLIGGLAGFAIMSALYYLGVLFSKYRAGRLKAQGIEPDDEEALGAGDVILAGILGFILGWPIIWFSLLLGILLGGVIGLLLILGLLLSQRYGKQALMVFMPYGPFFIASAFFILFLPNWIARVAP